MTPLSVIFLGTPAFAVPSLKAIHGAGHRILHVITQPDRPRGRGRRTVPSPVKTAALELGCSVLQPESIRDEAFLRSMERVRPDVLVLIAFGQLLPDRLIQLPRLGAINLHGSVLPKYRGPAPIQWAIINGETKTGVTTMLMDEGVDTGDILMIETSPIGPEDTSADLYDRLSRIGAGLMVKTLEHAAAGKLVPVPQDEQKASYAPMLSKSDGRINWDQAPERIECFIRGMTPWPGAFSHLDDARIKIFNARPAPLDHPEVPGTVVAGFENEIRVAARGGALSLLEIQSASGKRMAVSDYLRGHPVRMGQRLT